MTDLSKIIKIYNDIIESLNVAEGATSQLIHHAGHPMQFIIIREALASLKEICIKVAPQNVLMRPKTKYIKQ